ncbi:MAG TPA: endonuclease/exonuclease/phosphatase family protein [Mariprofundaceae bacterium]|nr:endonuclease/exonuclease/phosphatase family protein [Mariprofundaceae bacterium]
MPSGHLRIASFNMQAGIGSHLPHHLVTHGWRYLLPHRHVHANLEQIAEAIAPFDIVALQEADAGSFRTSYIHQQDYLAMRTGFSYSQSLITREMGPIACISLGILARIQLDAVHKHRLPASRHGRGALESVCHWQGQPIAIIATHLSLRRSSRLRQIDFIAQLVKKHPAAIVLGDLNCEPHSPEFRQLMEMADLQSGIITPATYPSWQPRRRIDHILTTRNLEICNLRTLPILCSDHLPIAAEIRFR